MFNFIQFVIAAFIDDPIEICSLYIFGCGTWWLLLLQAIVQHRRGLFSIYVRTLFRDIVHSSKRLCIFRYLCIWTSDTKIPGYKLVYV